MLKEGKVYVPKDKKLRVEVIRLYHDMSGPAGQSRIPLRGYEIKTRRTQQSSLYELPSYLYKYMWLC